MTKLARKPRYDARSAAPAGAKPGYGQRLAGRLVGCPSVSRANGGRNVSVLEKGVAHRRWEQRCAATPVYSLDASSRQHELPRIWITEPAYSVECEATGREFVAVYPSGRDEAGQRALRYAHAYFGEALSYSSSSQSAIKTDCFRAAEVLFLHAAQRGCVEAYVKLGLIYLDDLCEGRYCHELCGSNEEKRQLLYSRAYECFTYAAAHDCAEACCQLIDLSERYTGAVASPERLCALAERAFDIAELNHCAVDKGNAALRLARLHEYGIGFEQSFRRAYAWYRIAEEELSFVVDQGGWYFKRSRLKAEKGVLRMRQELVGGY
ncbi:MAG: sel1 repeat family protein [Eggerthellaceae bacterium]|nr:sel1 repeat family protein [Eggerthellaceae bacterium]